MMARIDEFVARITRRLQIDPELHLDVSSELRSHLEDSAAEFQAAGCSEQEARGQAIRSLGQEDELASLIWQANRSRIRLRKVARWGVRAALLPAVFLLAAWLAVQAVVPLIIIADPQASFSGHLVGPAGPDWHLTDDERFLVFGTREQTVWGRPVALDILTRDRNVAKRWPDNALYWGNYVNTFLAAETPSLDASPEKYRAFLQRLQPLLARGRELDPDNAFYDVAEAALLLRTAVELSEREDCTYDHLSLSGDVEPEPCMQVIVRDSDLLGQAMGLLTRAAARPTLHIPSLEMTRLRSQVLGEAESFSHLAAKAGLEISYLLPQLSDWRRAVRVLAGRGLQLAEQGDLTGAEDLFRIGRMLSLKIGAESGSIVQLLVAQSCLVSTLGHVEKAYASVGLDEQSKLARRRRFEQSSLMRDLFGRDRQRQRRWSRPDPDAGLLHQVFIPAVPGYQVDYRPLRRAEYFGVDQITLAGVLLAFAAAVGALLLWSGWNVLRHRRLSRGLMLFVGWRRTLTILVGGLALPVALHAAIMYLTPLGGRELGLVANWSHMSLLQPIAPLLALVGVTALAVRSARERIAESALPDKPTEPSRRRVAIVLTVRMTLLAAVVGLIVLGSVLLDPSLKTEQVIAWAAGSVLLTGLYVAGYLLTGGYSLSLRRSACYRRSLVRTAGPIVAAAAVLLAVTAGPALERAEARALSEASGPTSGLTFTNEVERSDFRKLRRRFQDLHADTMSTSRVGPVRSGRHAMAH